MKILKGYGVTEEQQEQLEMGLKDAGILKMQKRKIAEMIAARANVSIAPKPSATKKGAPSK